MRLQFARASGAFDECGYRKDPLATHGAIVTCSRPGKSSRHDLLIADAPNGSDHVPVHYAAASSFAHLVVNDKEPMKCCGGFPCRQRRSRLERHTVQNRRPTAVPARERNGFVATSTGREVVTQSGLANMTRDTKVVRNVVQPARYCVVALRERSQNAVKTRLLLVG